MEKVNRHGPKFFQGILGLAFVAAMISGCGGEGQGSPTAQKDSFIVVSPHPDDEDIMAAGTIFRHTHDESSVVELVYISSGDAAGLPGPCHKKSEEVKKQKIVALREEEARTACGVLGVDAAHIHFLRYPDSKLVASSTFSEGRRVDELTQAGKDAVARKVGRATAEMAPILESLSKRLLISRS